MHRQSLLFARNCDRAGVFLNADERASFNVIIPTISHQVFDSLFAPVDLELARGAGAGYLVDVGVEQEDAVLVEFNGVVVQSRDDDLLSEKYVLVLVLDAEQGAVRHTVKPLQQGSRIDLVHGLAFQYPEELVVRGEYEHQHIHVPPGVILYRRGAVDHAVLILLVL